MRNSSQTLLPSALCLLPSAFKGVRFRTAPSEGEGRGLGLTVIQEILANHGATFWLENREGGGAEFGVRLPPRN